MDLTHAAAALAVQVFSVRTPGLHLYVGLRAETGNSHLTHPRFAWGGGWEVATSLWHLAGPQSPSLSSRPRGGEVGTGWEVLQRLRETGGRLIEVKAGTGYRQSGSGQTGIHFPSLIEQPQPLYPPYVSLLPTHTVGSYPQSDLCFFCALCTRHAPLLLRELLFIP